MVIPSNESFPPVTPGLNSGTTPRVSKSSNEPRARRRASGLGGELWGDTGAPALATLDLWQNHEKKSHHARTHKKYSPKRRNHKSWLKQYRSLALQHTWLTPLVLVLCILTLYAVNPTPSNSLHTLLFLSHAPPTSTSPLDIPTQYAKGPSDLLFVAFQTLLLTLARQSLTTFLLSPLAIHFHITTPSKRLRFTEQSYQFLYWASSSLCGIYLLSSSPLITYNPTSTFSVSFNISGLYASYPNRTLSGAFKFYYLFQASYWVQQALVVGFKIEKPRKDYWQLMGHHFVTLALITLSYRFHFTYMGLAVFVTHDLSDAFFALSKILHYTSSPLTGPYFVFVMVAWIYLRHYLNIRILISEFYEFQTVGPYVLDWEQEMYKCELSRWISTILLGGLQGLNLYWGCLILRTGWRFGVKGELGDERSEDEDEEAVVGGGREAELSVVGSKAEGKVVVGMRGSTGGMPKRRAR